MTTSALRSEHKSWDGWNGAVPLAMPGRLGALQGWKGHGLPRSLFIEPWSGAGSSSWVCRGRGGGGKEREEREGRRREKKKNLTQKPQGIFCLFRILGREKIATVIQSILDNNSLFTVCMQRWQAGSAVRGTGMRNSPGALRLRRRRRRRRAGAEEGTALQWGEPAWRAEPHSCTQSKPGREAACSAQLVYCAPQLVPAWVLLYQTKTGGNPPSVQS